MSAQIFNWLFKHNKFSVSGTGKKANRQIVQGYFASLLAGKKS